MRVEWLARAEQDRQSQLDYIGKRNAPAAIELGDAIEEAVQLLTTYPEAGRLGRISGTWELVVPDTPYVLAYRIEITFVVILRLMHGAQRWPRSM